MKRAVFVALLVLCSSVFGAEENKNNNEPQPSLEAPTAMVSTHQLLAEAKTKTAVTPQNDDFALPNPSSAPHSLIFEEDVDFFTRATDRGWEIRENVRLRAKGKGLVLQINFD